MHILIALHDFPAGGTERVALNLARLWLGMGAHVTFLAGLAQGAQRERVPAGADVIQLAPAVPRSALSRLRLGPAMVPQIARLRPDVVMLPGNFHFIVAHALRRAFPALPIVAKLSNPALAGVPRMLHVPAAAAFRRLTAPLTRLVAMNTSLAAEASELIGTGRLAVIPDPLGLVPGPDFARTPQPNRLLWAGRLEPQKNVMLAVEAVARLAENGPIHLDLVGDGAQAEEARALARRLGVQALITFHGHVPSIQPFLASARALLLTSRYEGQPAVVAEALAHGVPVVSTASAGELDQLLADPIRGRVVHSFEADALAQAVRLQLALPEPPPESLAAAVADRLPEHSARAWLDLFDTLSRQC